ncbi:MAG: AAA family ATPase, partial [Dehalococcoidia bacterium]
GGQSKQVSQRTRELIDALEMGEWENKTGETFSGGVRRLVAFCMAAVVPGQIVILDEPTNDVDPLRRRLLWKQIRALSEAGSAIMLVTHNVLEAEHVVDRLAIMYGGEVQRIGRPAELKEQNGHNMRIEVFFEPGKTIDEIPDYLYKPLTTGQRLVAKFSEQYMSKTAEWANVLKANNVIEEFSLGPTTLEDAYIRIIGREDTLESSESEGEDD